MYKEKLTALLEGFECSNINEIVEKTPGHLRTVGVEMAKYARIGVKAISLERRNNMNQNKSEDKPMREKYWDELDDSGKINRLHRVVKDQEIVIIKMAGYLTELTKHSHLKDGRIVRNLQLPDIHEFDVFYYPKRDIRWF